MKIESLHIENFLSFGEATLSLDDVGLVLVEGDNRDDESASSNGSGKSALIDALVWCLFGKTLRGYEHDEVIHRRVGEGCLVEVCLTDGDELYTVRRARRHRKLKNSLTVTHDNFGEDMTAPGDKETQLVVERLLGCTLKTFLSSVVFGQDRAYRFSSLTDGEQKKILDEVIGVERFAQACAAARTRAAELSRSLDANRRALERAVEDRDDAEAEVAHLKAKDADFTASRRERVDVERAKLADVRTELDKARRFRDADKLKKAHDVALKVLAAAERAADKAVDADASARSHVDGMKAKLDEASAKLKRHRRAADTCPTCGQKVDAKKHAQVLDELAKEISALETGLTDVQGVADDVAALLVGERDKLKDARDAVTAAQKAVTAGVAAEAEFAGLRRRAADHQARIDELEAEENPYAALAAKAHSRHTQLAADADQLTDYVGHEEAELRRVEFWVKAYGTGGLRSLLVDSSLPLLNREASRVSRIVTGGTIDIEFSATSEQKSGKVVDRFEVRVDNEHGAGTYSGNSAGERAKVDLCVGLALQRLVASRSSASFNLAFYDEIFDHLDSAAHERVIEVLASLDKDSVLVVSHNDDLKAWFPATLRVVKRGGFSSIES